MKHDLSTKQLAAAGASGKNAGALIRALTGAPDDPAAAWQAACAHLTPAIPFEVHRLVYEAVFGDWDEAAGPPPAWRPEPSELESTNIAAFCRANGIADYPALYEWSISERATFWDRVIDALSIRFSQAPSATLGAGGTAEHPDWLPGASMNIADSCFQAPSNQTAVVYQREGGRLETLSYAELDAASSRFANAVRDRFEPGDVIAIAMPMTVEAVVAYLGAIRAGCAVASIADSFSPEEIATRLRIAGARAAVTQDVILRGEKTLPMYERVARAGVDTAIVVTAADRLAVDLRKSDVAWDDFLSDDDTFDSKPCAPNDTINVLFSSGTTGDPKAIPWNHMTPIKCAMDGYFHQDIRPGDVVAWPTNIGWMMGPWLVFASLMNRGTMALYYGAPGTRGFCEFVQNAGVQMLGVVPSLVKAWRSGDTVAGFDWSRIKLFSSTGEASNAEDYLYLMSLAGYRPVVEYCGGTEIGGGYITGTLVQPASPATFSTPSLGLSLYLLDDDRKPADSGELFLVPPSIGLSTRLLNRDHHEVYYKDTPAGPNGEVLRRHGDEMERLPNGYYRAHGRADDTMNISGIKVSSAEIERAVATVEGVVETAAIAVDPPGGGPSRLVIYAVMEKGADPEAGALKKSMQKAIASGLNPLFKIHDVVPIDALPRTASNKVMRRVLRDRYAD